MSQANLLINLISSLLDDEFDDVAKLYLQEIDGIKNIIKCNGPYDKGLDFRPSNATEIESQYQATTTAEKRFAKKIDEDLQKAKRNAEQYDLPKRVKYFYNQPLTNGQVLNYKKFAKDNYNITLDLIEANSIAETAEVFSSISDLLYKLADFDKYRGSDDDFFDSPRVRSFYDLMSFGSSTNIKANIIKSFILYFLCDKSQIDQKDLLEAIDKHFETKLDPSYLESLLRRMSSEGLTTFNEEKIELRDKEKQRLLKLLENYGNEEALLRKDLTWILSKYNLQQLLEEILKKLTELYESNYAINLGEFTKRETHIHDFQTATKDFNEFLKSKMENPELSENLTTELLEIAEKSELLSRIALGQVYSKVSDPDRLQDYITRHNNNKTIFLDTNFLIVALCVFYEPEANYDNYHFKIAKRFLKYVRQNGLHLVVVKTYMHETAKLFVEALNIIPFTKIPHFEALGGSSNILYRFYKHLKDYSLLHLPNETFEEFLKEFKFEIKDGYDEYNYNEQMEWLLKQMEIDVEIPERYDLNKTKEIIEQDLKEHDRYKSKFAINNDAIMFRRLGDSDTDVNPIDPIFCTWDMSLFRVRRLYFQEYPNTTRWLMYTPTRLMDHFSMMKFQIPKGSLINEVLSILEVDYAFQEKTQTLLDTMVTIINPSSDIGLQYSTKLIELQQSEILQLDEQPENIVEESNENTPLDIIFKDLFIRYSREGEGTFHTFKQIFTKTEYFERTFVILDEEIKNFKDLGYSSHSLFDKFDTMINEIYSTTNDINVESPD